MKGLGQITGTLSPASHLPNAEAAPAKIDETGVIPAVRAATAGEAMFAAETIALGGIPIVELTMTVQIQQRGYPDRS